MRNTPLGATDVQPPPRCWLPCRARALEPRRFSSAALAQALARNQPVAVHLHADWCPTCRAQETVLQSFQSDKALDMTPLVAWMPQGWVDLRVRF